MDKTNGKDKLVQQLSQKQETDTNFDKTFFSRFLKNTTGVCDP